MGHPVTGGVVSRVHRYPVKSLRGERLDASAVQRHGLAGDRLWAVRTPEGRLGSGKSTRRFRRIDGLLAYTARDHGDVTTIVFPDGTRHVAGDPATDAALSERLGQPVRLQREGDVAHKDDAPVHLVTTGSLRWLRRHLPEAAVDERRFRPNLVVETAETGRVEQAWIGARLTIGDAVLLVTHGTERCVMVNAAQGDLPEDRTVLRALARFADLHLGVYADVVTPGTVARGDPVTVHDPAG